MGGGRISRWFDSKGWPGLLIAVLFAGQHTSSITSSWTGYFMIDSKVGQAPARRGACMRRCMQFTLLVLILRACAVRTMHACAAHAWRMMLCARSRAVLC